MAFDLKNYEEVKDRIPRFWEKYPTGAIDTELFDHEGNEYIFKATLIDDTGRKIATGWAQEIIGSSPVNKLSALENCETSAIGRALANAGFSTGKNRPSREEMDKAVRADSANTPPDEAGGPRPASGPRLATPKQRTLLENLIETHTVPDGCAWPLAEDLTMRDCSGYIDELKKLNKPETERVSTLRKDLGAEEIPPEEAPF